MRLGLFNFLYLNQVFYFAHHSQNLGGCFVYNRVVHFTDAQCGHCGLLACGTIDRTAHLCDFNLSHNVSLSTVKNLRYGNTALTCNFIHVAQLMQGFKSSFYQVVRIRRTF